MRLKLPPTLDIEALKAALQTGGAQAVVAKAREMAERIEPTRKLPPTSKHKGNSKRARRKEKPPPECYKKKRYHSIEQGKQGKAVAERARGVKLRVYPCPACFGFHLSRSGA